MQKVFIFIGLISVIVYIVSTIMMCSYLKDRGEKVSFLWLRLFIFSYVNKYKESTKKETGKIGYLFYLWIISINITLISAILLNFVL